MNLNSILCDLHFEMEPLTKTVPGEVYSLAAVANPVPGQPGQVQMSMMPVRIYLQDCDGNQLDLKFVPPEGAEPEEPKEPSRIIRPSHLNSV